MPKMLSAHNWIELALKDVETRLQEMQSMETEEEAEEDPSMTLNM